MPALGAAGLTAQNWGHRGGAGAKFQQGFGTTG